MRRRICPTPDQADPRQRKEALDGTIVKLCKAVQISLGLVERQCLRDTLVSSPRSQVPWSPTVMVQYVPTGNVSFLRAKI